MHCSSKEVGRVEDMRGVTEVKKAVQGTVVEGKGFAKTHCRGKACSREVLEGNHR
jgi:hypothetical protein